MPNSHGRAHRETPQRAVQALPSSARWAKKRVFEAIEAIEESFQRKELGHAVSTGFQKLDLKLEGGLRQGEMVVIAGRPFMGKTAFALQIADHVAVESRLPVVIFTLDVSASHLTQRLLCSRAQISLDRMLKGRLTKGDFARLLEVTPKLAQAPLLIDEGPDLDLEELDARLRAAVKTHGIRLAIVDYLQLIRREPGSPPGNYPAAIAEVSERIKLLARELNISILALSPLNRNLENRKDHWPRPDDIRGTRQIARDADIIILLYRQDVYIETDMGRRKDEGKTTVIIAKHPRGSTDDFLLGFNVDWGRFYEVTLRKTKKAMGKPAHRRVQRLAA